MESLILINTTDRVARRATTGIDQSRSRIAVAVPAMTILDALEIIPATDAAAASIETAGVAK